jgi:putative membrane protein
MVNEADRQRIAQAIAAGESETSVEFNLVLAHASSHYGAFALIDAGVVALLGGGVIAALRPDLPANWIFIAQVVVFLLAVALLQISALRRALAPPSVKRKAAWRNARLHYADLCLKQPHSRGMILIFCSAAERSVEILVDDAIAERLPDPVWHPVVAEFKSRFARGDVAEAFINATISCAALLTPVFPPQPGQKNEIPDTLVEV